MLLASGELARVAHAIEEGGALDRFHELPLAVRGPLRMDEHASSIVQHQAPQEKVAGKTVDGGAKTHSLHHTAYPVQPGEHRSVRGQPGFFEGRHRLRARIGAYSSCPDGKFRTHTSARRVSPSAARAIAESFGVLAANQARRGRQ